MYCSKSFQRCKRTKKILPENIFMSAQIIRQKQFLSILNDTKNLWFTGLWQDGMSVGYSWKSWNSSILKWKNSIEKFVGESVCLKFIAVWNTDWDSDGSWWSWKWKSPKIVLWNGLDVYWTWLLNWGWVARPNNCWRERRRRNVHSWIKSRK